MDGHGGDLEGFILAALWHSASAMMSLRWMRALDWGIIGALFASQLWLFQHFSVDDAFITFRYVRQLVAGNGLVYNIGERVEGYSNFLWVMLLAPAHALGMELLTAARLIAIILSAGTLLITYRLAADSPLPILAPVLLAACAPFTAWTMGGLETALFAFLLTAAAYTFIREEASGSGSASGLIFGLLALSRPEGVLFFGLALAYRLWHRVTSGNATTVSHWSHRLLHILRREWRWLAGFAIVFAPHFLWRLSYYGWPLPNTVYAKSMGLHPRAFVEGAYYLFEGMTALGGPGFVLLPAALVALKAHTPRHAFLLTSCAAYALFVIIGGGDWMPLHRFWAHILPLLIVLAHRGMMTLAGFMATSRSALIGIGLTLVQLAVLLFNALDARLVRGIGQPIAPQGQTMSDYLRAHWQPGDVLAVTDAGWLAYILPLEARVVDMFGLTDAHIAHLTPQFPGGLLGRGDGFGKWDVDYVLAQNPRFIQAHVIAKAPDGTFIADNTSNRLLVNDPRFKARYRQVADTPELRGLFESVR